MKYMKTERALKTRILLFLLGLFDLYSETILRKHKVLPGLIISGHSLNNIRYVDDTLLIADRMKARRKDYAPTVRI